MITILEILKHCETFQHRKTKKKRFKKFFLLCVNQHGISARGGPKKIRYGIAEKCKKPDIKNKQKKQIWKLLMISCRQGGFWLISHSY